MIKCSVQWHLENTLTAWTSPSFISRIHFIWQNCPTSVNSSSLPPFSCQPPFHFLSLTSASVDEIICDFSLNGLLSLVNGMSLGFLQVSEPYFFLRLNKTAQFVYHLPTGRHVCPVFLWLLWVTLRQTRGKTSVWVTASGISGYTLRREITLSLIIQYLILWNHLLLFSIEKFKTLSLF